MIKLNQLFMVHLYNAFNHHPCLSSHNLFRETSYFHPCQFLGSANENEILQDKDYRDTQRLSARGRESHHIRIVAIYLAIIENEMSI